MSHADDGELLLSGDHGELAPEPGWAPLQPRGMVGLARSFVSGEPHGNRLRVVYYEREADRALVGKAWFGPMAEGPPGHAHGGSMAALLDEAMGCACWLVGRTVLAKKIEVEFKRPLRLLTTVVIEARLVRSSGRRCYAEGRLTLAGGEECASSTGLFIELPLERLASLVGSERGPLD